jgi:hypothetical protein
VRPNRPTIVVVRVRRPLSDPGGDAATSGIVQTPSSWAWKIARGGGDALVPKQALHRRKAHPAFQQVRGAGVSELMQSHQSAKEQRGWPTPP